MWYFRKHTVVSVPGLIVLALTLSFGIAFFAYIGVANKRSRLVKRNEFLYMWEAFIGTTLGLQALFVVSAYRASNRYLYWTLGWILYGIVMCALALCVVGGYGATKDAGAAIWAVLWAVPAVAISVYAAKARRGYAVDRVMGIPEFRPRLSDSRGSVLCMVALDTAFPWTTWLIGVFFALLVAIQALALANDHRLYKQPGRLVPVQTNGGEDWYDMHVWCAGYDAETQKSNRPVFVLLPDFGMPSTSMQGLMQGFANAGHPACIVDRPGYGWSEPGYWMQDPRDVVQSINQALDKYPVANPLILVGWGEGGVWSQLYMQAADATRVIGMVLLDTYPNLEILQTFALNRTTTLQNLRQFRSLGASRTDPVPVVNFDRPLERSVSRMFSDWRAVSPLALHRARNAEWPGFQPQTSLGMHKSRFRDNLHYQAKYFEYGGSGARLYQSLLDYVSPSIDSVLVYHHWPLRWPALPATAGSAFTSSLTRRQASAPVVTAVTSNIPVILIASSAQFNSDCSAHKISDSEECTKWQAFAWFYYRQQIEYQQTLSQNAALLACVGEVEEDKTECDVDFVWRRPEWLAKVVVKQLFSQTSGTESSSSESSSSAKPTSSSESAAVSVEPTGDSESAAVSVEPTSGSESAATSAEPTSAEPTASV
ncbi:hypothetical protein EV176_001943 [Coemansia sp. RSA 451]|nr:hypothetical protein EV176_001943 [Coemansia sp. RSA 451]